MYVNVCLAQSEAPGPPHSPCCLLMVSISWRTAYGLQMGPQGLTLRSALTSCLTCGKILYFSVSVF